jgi:hypothetical protein
VVDRNLSERIVQNAVAVAFEARDLCYGDATPELATALRERAVQIQKGNRTIRAVALAAELLTWLNGNGERGAERSVKRRRPVDFISRSV